MGFLFPSKPAPVYEPEIDYEEERGVSDADLRKLTDTQIGFIAQAQILLALDVADDVLIDELIRRGVRGLAEAKGKR